MTDEDQQYQKRWGFRRNDSDLDSSSDDTQPSPAGELKLKKHTQATRLFPDKNDQQTLCNPQSHPGVEIHSSFEGPTREPFKPCKKPQRKPRKRAYKETVNEECTDTGHAALFDLREHMDSLVEGVKVARDNLLKWMNSEMGKCKCVVASSKPCVTRKSQRRGSKEAQNSKRGKTPRTSPNKARKKQSGARNQNHNDNLPEDLSKDDKTSHQTTEEMVLPSKEPEMVVNDTAPAEQNEKQKKRTLGSSTKKQKVVAGNQQSDKVAATDAAADATATAHYLTLPTVLPRKDLESGEKAQSEDRDDQDIRNGSALNPTINLSPQPNCTPIYQQRDGLYAQNGLRNASNFDQNMIPTNGNLLGTNGNGFQFPLPFQGLNGGFGMPNISSQFGMPYLSQESRISGMSMNGGPSGLLSRNHAFIEGYSTLNQQLRFNAQGGVMAFHPPDHSRAGNPQPR